MSSYHIFLSLHIIGFVSWFAGLFYYVRLLIYHQETLTKNLSREVKETLLKQFLLMARKLKNIIIFPAMIFTWSNGLALMWITKSFQYDWFHFKFLFLLLLTFYTLFCSMLFKRIIQHRLKPLRILSNLNLRLLNELATVLLILIVSLAVFKKVSVALVFSFVVVGEYRFNFFTDFSD